MDSASLKYYAGIALAVLAAGTLYMFSKRTCGGRKQPPNRIDPVKNPKGAVDAVIDAARSFGGPMLPSEIVLALRATEKDNVISEELLAALETAAGEQGAGNFVRYGVSGARSMRQIMKALEDMRTTPFDNSSATANAMLRSLWDNAFAGYAPVGAASPSDPAPPFDRPSELWGRMGFQGLDPATDLRGGGLLALKHFAQFSLAHRKELQEMMQYNEDVQSRKEHHWFLPAVVSIQFTVQLMLREHPLHPAHLRVIYATEDARAAAAARGDAMRANAIGGLAALHDEMLLLFFEMWKEHKPHVMEYSLFLPKFHAKFFSPEWRPKFSS